MTATKGTHGTPENAPLGLSNQPDAAAHECTQRRKLLKKMAWGTAALAGCSLIPEKWTSPLVEFGALPAHAVTSAVSRVETATQEPRQEPQPKVSGTGSGNFSLIFEMTHQACDSCGIWFDSAVLKIVHSQGTFSKSQSGSLLIKRIPYRQGRFSANISSIPSSANITSAILYMRLNSHEGIANSDSRSVVAVYDNSSGRKGALVRRITAAGDIKGRGYSKSNPVVPIDFTAYAIQIHGS